MSAILFASAANGPVFAKILFFSITPLPIFIAGLSLGWISAALGGLAGAIAISALLATVAVEGSSPGLGIAVGATQVLPPVILCYLAQLNRVSSTGAGPQNTIEWYPIGRLILWSAAIGSVLAILTLLLMGQDLGTLQESFRKAIEKLVEQQMPDGGGNKLSQDDLTKIVEVIMSLLPAFLSISIMGTLLLNMWLAGRISLSFGRLFRPWQT